MVSSAHPANSKKKKRKIAILQFGDFS